VLWELFNDYFKRIVKIHKTGQATELTYRHDFQNFIENLFSDLKLSEENRSIKKIGRPDYTCFKKSKIKLGYIETKDIGVDLNKEIKGEQIKKYSEGAIPNIILTDYMRFILIRNQEVIFDVDLFKLYELNNDKKIFDEKNINDFKTLFETFINYSLPTIRSPTELAIELSKRAKLLRDLAQEQLEEDLIKQKNNESVTSIYDFYEAFKELIKDAKISDCVDAYSQTITYGLFLSKIGSHDGLNRDSAVTYIPSSIKIIKKIFMNIAGDELPHNLSWVVDEIIDLLNSADLKKILDSFVFEGKHYRDPFIHFYEDFLKEYDPEKRKHLGVYYTPEPVVYFITNAINEMLKKEFGKSKGFADDSVKVLDFASGTGTFLANSFVLALKEIRKSGLTGIEKDKIKNHLLKNFYGFEILISPYVIAHLKLSLLLNKEGYNLNRDERVQVYLTNTLDPTETLSTLTGFFKELSHETLMANSIKLEKPILVIMGNPPYSVSSSNKSEWIIKLMKDYKKDLKERNIQPLDDDYIKFIRFAQWKIEQNKIGMIGIISNNSYLDGVIHRQMRKEILSKFNSIYILNLHGDSRKGEKTPEGRKDENVFDIQQGVAIAIFVKNKGNEKAVHYVDLYGLRKDKYKFLQENKISEINFEDLNPKQPYYFLTQKDFSSKRKYDNFFKIDDIFNIGSSGVNTARDYLLVGFTKEEVSLRIESIKKENYNLLMKNLESDLRRNEVKDIFKTHKIDNNIFYNYDYRPFNIIKIYYFKELIDRDRNKVMQHFVNHKNYGIILRKNPVKRWNHIFITEEIIDGNYLEARSYVFPLYVYNGDSGENQQTLSGKHIKSGKQPNFKDEFIEFIKNQYPNKEIKPEEILDYVYAVLHSNKYRKKYHEFLKIDFPRIPFVKEYQKFKKIYELGNQLRDLHLMKINFNRNIAKFEKSGSNLIEFIKYEKDRIYINKDQYFDNINKDLWNFYIGGYQVLDKWLKSRKNRKLSSNEIETFIKIVNVLSETIKIMEKIEKIKID